MTIVPLGQLVRVSVPTPSPAASSGAPPRGQGDRSRGLGTRTWAGLQQADALGLGHCCLRPRTPSQSICKQPVPAVLQESCGRKAGLGGARPHAAPWTTSPSTWTTLGLFGDGCRRRRALPAPRPPGSDHPALALVLRFPLSTLVLTGWVQTSSSSGPEASVHPDFCALRFSFRRGNRR